MFNHVSVNISSTGSEIIYCIICLRRIIYVTTIVFITDKPV